MSDYPAPNPGKRIRIILKGQTWSRWPIKTPVIHKDTDLGALISESVKPWLKPGDLILIAESVVAITQDRALKFDEIRASKAAVFLSRFVKKTPHGIGLGTPGTMQLAINECGLMRILFAACLSPVGKVLRIPGLFYRMAGPQARLIDGPCENTLPPYNEYATLGPKDPQGAAQRLSEDLGAAVAIVDANDLGVNCIGAFPKKFNGWNSYRLAEAMTKDNPSGQSSEQTPVILGRLNP